MGETVFTANRLASALTPWRAVAAVLALLAFAVLVAFSFYQSAQLAKAELTQAQEDTRKAQDALKREQRANAVHASARVATARKQAAAGASVAAAVASNPAWAEQPVPQEIQDALTR